MRTLGRGIEGLAPDAGGGGGSSGARVRSRGLGIEGRPSRRESVHARKASAATSSSITKDGTGGTSVVYTEVAYDGGSNAGSEDATSTQNAQATLALLQTFHANTVFWLSKLREVVPPPSVVSSPGGRYRDDATSGDDGAGDEETITITARDLLSLELGVLSDLDARFVEWLVEAEGYAVAPSSLSPSSTQSRLRRESRGSRSGSGNGRKVVVKRGWQELLGIMVGLK